MTDREHARGLLEVADRDLRALKGMADAEVFADEIFGFHAQQAVEKALKAWIAALGGEYPYSHDISVLLTTLEELQQVVDDLWELVELNAFAVQLRYEMLTCPEERLDRPTTMKVVRDVIDRVRLIAGA